MVDSRGLANTQRSHSNVSMRGVAAQVVIKSNADRYAANVQPLIKDPPRAGATTLRVVVEALNARGVAAGRGGSWHAMSVKNVLDRQT